MVTKLLSDADAQAIEAAVARAESQSAAELVVAVVPQSDDYWQGRVALAVAWALAAGLAFQEHIPDSSAMWRTTLRVLAAERGADGKRRTHVLAAADRNESLETLAGFLARIGLKVGMLIPARAVMLASAGRAARETA